MIEMRGTVYHKLLELICEAKKEAKHAKLHKIYDFLCDLYELVEECYEESKEYDEEDFDDEYSEEYEPYHKAMRRGVKSMHMRYNKSDEGDMEKAYRRGVRRSRRY